MFRVHAGCFLRRFLTVNILPFHFQLASGSKQPFQINIFSKKMNFSDTIYIYI